MAKAFEDTAFYRYFRLLALNEVGGDPDRFSLPVDEFHRANQERAERFPQHLLATQTHDTKRSGDVRARIGALAGMADEWAEHARAWRILDDGHENYQLLQALVGAWPIGRERIEGYMEKAMREAGRNTNWTEPNAAHESAVSDAIGRFYDRLPEGFEAFVERVAAEGRRVSLAQTLLKLTAPGLPDIYQGDELESLNLVDPDNRRPVDWDARRRALADPPPKLRLIRDVLAFRKRRPEPFSGGYEPIDLGPATCAFVRGAGQVAIAVALRPGAEPELALPGRWNDVLSGEPAGIRLLERA
jgi:(1->4)-alpha-D-glucan 1-alpha-D-glucosylmutase